MRSSQKSLVRIKKKSFSIKGSYESLERLEGKIGAAPFFKVQPGKITVCRVESEK